MLEVREVSKHFGGLMALRKLSLHLERAEGVWGLIGPNGSGKTTLLNVICGLYRPDQGTVLFQGRRIDQLSPHQIARLGIGRTFQVAKVFRRLTVLENMLVPGFTNRETESPRQLREQALELLDFMQLSNLKDEQAGNLSGGQQKLLDFARVLMLKPKLLLLDEPFAGVHPLLKERMINRITLLHQQGIRFLVVSHDLPSVLELCSHLVVLSSGEKIAEGEPEMVRKEERVVEAYLGV
ncbi:MAG: ABC transporter ATP-binding protein [Nitrospinota bacterium]|nr:MAG: ABC transporter ATP-binding protein [Nitrospinota bacterium]